MANLFQFLSDDNVELTSYVDTGTITLGSSGGTFTVNPSQDIDTAHWRVYGSVDGGTSWFSDSYVIYNAAAGSFIAYKEIYINSRDSVANTLNIQYSTPTGSTLLKYILVGLR